MPHSGRIAIHDREPRTRLGTSIRRRGRAGRVRVPAGRIDPCSPALDANHEVRDAPIDAVRRLLNETLDRALACQAAEAAVVMGDEELINLALMHPRADARQIALEHRLSMCNGIIPDRLLAFAHDKGCRVRSVLLDKIVQ